MLQKLLGGSAITYGPTLPLASLANNGQLFVKTSALDSIPAGLYIFQTYDSTTSPGDNFVQGWKLVNISGTINGGGLEVQLVTGTTVNAVPGKHYVLMNGSAQSTVTLPAAPVVGDVVFVGVASARQDSIVARNGALIMGVAEDLTLDYGYVTYQFQFVGSTQGWRFL